ncbi:MAG: DNA polymerase III subunit epsilon [Legionellaceae bacterium]|nr:DNA polymerase III subunit epsilon [Legionellaceae bacterium]
MRQVVLDTETTGLDPKSGHRVIEIGCVELIDRKFTGNHYHIYINPEREVDDGAFKVHGISNLFLQDKPVFKDIFDDFMHFVDGSELIIHNAPFDVGFLNSEFKHIKYSKKLEDHCSILDSLVYARKKHAGQRNTLDALCKRYYIDNSNRELHGALLDAEILAFVYLAMTGGQTELFAEQSKHEGDRHANQEHVIESLSTISPVHLATSEELRRHQEFLEFMDEK